MSTLDADGVLAAIDAACEDWDVSEDAMRWAPEPPAINPPASGGFRFDLPDTVVEHIRRTGLDLPATWADRLYDAHPILREGDLVTIRWADVIGTDRRVTTVVPSHNGGVTYHPRTDRAWA